MNRLIELLFARRGMSMNDYFDMESLVGGKLAGMDEVLACLHEISQDTSGRTLVVAPDFDMDGIMSGTVLVAGLSELGFSVELFVPNPSSGYGLTADEAHRLLDTHPNVGWVITCDMGISCVDGLSVLHDAGVPAIITDHHKEPVDASKSARSIAWAMVDPCGVGETYPLPQICGAYVAWLVVRAYADMYGSTEVADRIERLRVFAGIGTVSDLMPLVHENRQLVRDAIGLCRLIWANPDPWFVRGLEGGMAYRRAFDGLAFAIKAFNDEHPFSSPLDVNEKFLGFSFAPTFNAAKRMNVDMGHAFNVFFGDAQARAMGMSALMSANAARKALVKTKLSEIKEQDNPGAPIVYITDASSGIVGLLASNLQGHSGYPTLVLHANDDGTYSGSGRSPEWYPFIDRAAVTFGIAASGHNGAFGVRFDSLQDAMDAAVLIRNDADQLHAALGIDDTDMYDLVIDSLGGGDMWYDVGALYEFVSFMDAFAPFGRGWPEPRVLAIAHDSEYHVSRMGTDGRHLRITLPHGLTFISWNAGDMADDVTGTIELSGVLSLNEFAGNVSVQLIGDVEKVRV